MRSMTDWLEEGELKGFEPEFPANLPRTVRPRGNAYAADPMEFRQEASESSWSAEQGQLLAVFDGFRFPPSLSIGSAQFIDYIARKEALAERPF